MASYHSSEAVEVVSRHAARVLQTLLVFLIVCMMLVLLSSVIVQGVTSTICCTLWGVLLKQDAKNRVPTSACSMLQAKTGVETGISAVQVDSSSRDSPAGPDSV